jgi:ribosomal protein S18 acetylase RimI-like enzyme
MLVLAAENAAGAVVGRVWVALQWPGKIGAICQIEVVAEQRGKGYGRALLRAAEEATAAEGVEAIGLNVFGENTVARSLYASSGYGSPRCRCASSCAPVTRSPRRSRRVPGHEQA